MNAIPTKYKGVQFRSRLEARWAAFFELRHQKWEYEPLEFAGYIPDFTLLMLQGRVLIEVKPIRDVFGAGDACRKIEASGWHGPAAIVGVDPSAFVSSMGPLKSPVIVDGFPRGVFMVTQGWVWSDSNWIVGDWKSDWTEAGNLTQYKSPRKRCA